MIPKIIHYCWFGHNEYPEKVAYCIQTWKKYLPDYELRLWNEDNFDISCCRFVREAYDAKQYAFVSDYVRLKVLEECGGIYLDTDIEVVRSFEEILNHDVVLGADENGNLTAFMATVSGHPFFSEMVVLYDSLNFLLPNGKFNTKVNNQWMQEQLAKYGFELKNEYQILDLGIVVFPDDFFHAKSLVSGKLHRTKNTFCIHHHTSLWVPFYTKVIKFLRMKLFVPLLGAEKYQLITEKIKKGKGNKTTK